jgi:hypothetical protein
LTTDVRASPRRPRAKLFFWALLVGIGLSGPGTAESAEIEGIHFADTIQLSGDPAQELRLRGLGLLRYRIVFRGYVAALYLPDRVSGDAVLEDVPRRLELSYFWPIAGRDFAQAADQLLERALSAPQLIALRPRIDALNRAYRDVRPDDRYSLTYVPEIGTELRLNDELLITVPGEDFAAAYFGIWLGSKPLDDGLRDDLLDRR